MEYIPDELIEMLRTIHNSAYLYGNNHTKIYNIRPDSFKCVIKRTADFIADSKPLTGQWILITIGKYNHIFGTCSNCGYETYINTYCGNCGSKNTMPKTFTARYMNNDVQ